MTPPKRFGAAVAPPAGRPPLPAPRPLAPHLRTALQASRAPAATAPPAATGSVQPRMSGVPPQACPSPRAAVLAPPTLPPPRHHRPVVAQPCCWPFSLCFGGGGTEEEQRPLRQSTSPQSIPQRQWAGHRVEPSERSGEIRLEGTEIRIWNTAARSSEVEGVVRDFLRTGRMTLYRGMSAYHPNFKSALSGSVQPLGTGGSSFDTGSSAWTAWQWDYDAAVGIAVSVRGMDLNDRIEKVPGYDKSDAEFVVGVVLTIDVGLKDSFTFYNSTEVQVQGAQQARVTRMKMGTKLSKFPSLQHYQSQDRQTIADIMPDPGD